MQDANLNSQPIIDSSVPSNLVYLPSQYVLNGKLLNNPLIQLRQPEIICEAKVSPVRVRQSRGNLIKREGAIDIIVLKSRKFVSGKYERLVSPQSKIPSDEATYNSLKNRMKWDKPRTEEIGTLTLEQLKSKCEEVRKSWSGQFSFQEEERENGIATKKGLRSAQIGALHATLAHWQVSDKPATVVMPTGTGKTETMLALMVNRKINRLLVVVPTDALRTQIANKFIMLGLLKDLGVVGRSAQFPIVGIIEHRMNPDETERFIESCNVIVTTMSIISGFDEAVQVKIAEKCSHLFIDEAHHIAAQTWEKFRRFFLKKVILQFTATPYRGDGRHVDGKVIFNFPLRKAQEEGYFKQINFISLREYNPHKHDETIAKAAITQLEKDLSNNLQHLVMARVGSIQRAKEVFELYKKYATSHNPVLVHSRMSQSQRKTALLQLKSQQSKIVVCVDMFGEGFDLPELKIAALHDIHKSLAITIQFTGRFTRTKDNIGDATIFANVIDPNVEEALRNLYAEDADWNLILRKLSEGASDQQEKRSEFLEGFSDLPSEIPLQNILPKMSTVVYRTQCQNWEPDKVRTVVKESQLFAGPTVNTEHNVVLFVTCIREPVEWANIKDIYNTIWDLYVIHWNPTQKLLYINSSNKGSYHEALAKAVAGENVELIRGEQVFRTLHGVNRLIIKNLGLKHAFSRASTFTMHSGSDVGEGITEVQLLHKIKSNTFANGFEKGDKVSIGCSIRGRIWAYRVADSIPEWLEWCEYIGKKLQDTTIQVGEILNKAMVPEPIDSRPELVPLTIEWPENILLRSEDILYLDVAGDSVPFYEAGLELTEHTKQGQLKFRVFTENKSVEYEIKIQSGKVEYLPIGQETVIVKSGSKTKPLSEWLQEEPPTVRFEDGAFLVYNEIYRLKNTENQPYDKNKIDTWDWTGIDLNAESQTISKNQNSIQYKVIRSLLTSDLQYDIIFDDDDAYEAADVVAIKVVGEKIIVHFYHCKYALDGSPGARVNDLYAVCGQAQRSVFWKGEIKGLMRHLRKREINRLSKSKPSRFEKGDMIKLDEIEAKVAYLIPEFKVFIVQPGLSKANAADDQLILLSVTELYLQETYSVGLGVISSA